MKSPKKIFVVFGVVILIVSFGLATVSATTDANEKKNTGISLEAKEKKITSLKVSWNANGGKIGSKKTIDTSAKKGSKLKKLATTPKRTGFAFQGWHTKKFGGKKVTKNTKITKKVTFYAHWKKRSGNTNSKLVGHWRNAYYSYTLKRYDYKWYIFKNDGTFNYSNIAYLGQWDINGKYKVSGGKITFTNMVMKFEDGYKENLPNTVVEYQFEKYSDGKEYLRIGLVEHVRGEDSSYKIPISRGWDFNKVN